MALFIPCLNNICPCLASCQTRVFRVMRLNQVGLRDMSVDCLNLETMSGICVDHVNINFDRLYFPASWISKILFISAIKT